MSSSALPFLSSRSNINVVCAICYIDVYRYGQATVKFRGSKQKVADRHENPLPLSRLLFVEEDLIYAFHREGRLATGCGQAASREYRGGRNRDRRDRRHRT